MTGLLGRGRAWALALLAAAALPAFGIGSTTKPVIAVVDVREGAAADAFREAFQQRVAQRPADRTSWDIQYITCPLSSASTRQCIDRALRVSPTLVYVTSTTIARQLRETEPNVPIVFSGILDPRTMGLAKELSRPGSRMTGFISRTDVAAKQLEVLTRGFPHIKRIALVSNNERASESRTASFEAARSLGITLEAAELPIPITKEALHAFFCGPRFDAFDIRTTGYFRTHYAEVIAALRHCRKPAIFMHRDFVKAGGLMSYGANDFDFADKAVQYIDRALRATDPGDIPIEFSTNYALAINRTTAALLAVPLSTEIRMRATEVHR